MLWALLQQWSGSAFLVFLCDLIAEWRNSSNQN